MILSVHKQATSVEPCHPADARRMDAIRGAGSPHNMKYEVLYVSNF